MTTAERFWFALGWALGDDQVEPEHARETMNKIAGALRDCPPSQFTAFVLDYISPANEMRNELVVLARHTAWERSEAHAIADGEEAFDAYASHERAEGR